MEQPVFLNATQMDSPVEGIDAVRLGATVLPENPFVGLRPFESKEAVLFFGRRDQVKELLSILHASRFVSVVGSSGCGKSSLIRAGLIPNLQAGFVAGSVDRWNIITMKPGNSPLQNLATALLHSFQEKPQPPAVDALVRDIGLYGVSAVTSFLQEQTKDEKTNFLLLVDQFEEIFRFAAYDDADEKADADQNKLNQQMRETHREEATDLVSIMLDLVVQESVPVYVVMTMRSDFLGECDAFYGLPEAMNESQYLVPRLTRQQRQQAIEKPVQLYGAALTERLTDRVLNDMEEERDQLPIMQHALMRTWEKWQVKKGGPLDLPHYIEAGTVAEALSQDADDALRGLSQDELIIAERMFQALTTTDAKGRRLRRPTHLSELAAITGSREAVLKLIDRFRDNNRSFLMLSQDRDPLVDISHESLIRQWATLRKWVDDETEWRELYLRLANDAVRNRANLVELWIDPALQLALNWWSLRKPTEAWGRRYHKEFKLTEAFLKASEKKRDDDAKEVQRLKDEEAKREREELEKAQRQAELEKEKAQELAAARQRELEASQAFALLEKQQAEERAQAQQRELENAQLLDKQRAATIRRTRLLALGLLVFLVVVVFVAGWAWRAQIKATQTAAADKLRRKAANEQNAGEIDDAQTTYLEAASAYKKINDKEGIAYTYSELGNMLSSQVDEIATIAPSRKEDRDRWDDFVKPNWVDRVLLGSPAGEAYFNSIGLSKVHARGLDYYAEAIKAYAQVDGVSGFNGVAAVLEKVGDAMTESGLTFKVDEESQAFAARQRAIATRDSLCMALENYQRADNSNRRIALLNKIGDGVQKPTQNSSEDDSNDSVGASSGSDVGGCQGLGNDAATYYEESAKLYPGLLKKYQHESNQFKDAQQSYVDLLVKLGNLYYERSQPTKGTPDVANLNLATDRFDKAAEVFRADGDVENTVNTYKVIAGDLEEGDLKSRYYELGAAEYHRAGKLDSEAAFLLSIGRKYMSRSRSGRNSSDERSQASDKAIDYMNRALSLYQQQGKREDYSSVYTALGSIYRSLSKYDEALAAFQAALKNSLSIGDQKSLPRDYYNLGRTQESKGAKEDAKKSYDEVIRLTTNDLDNLFRRNAETGLKRLRGELPPLNAPK